LILGQQIKTRAGNADGKVDDLIVKWRTACQQVLLELQQKSPNVVPLGQLLAHFQIDPVLIQYNEEVDSF